MLPRAEAAGSSPRVRGKPPRDARGREFDGLIPARAGKTDYQDQCAERWTAHPRACGENPASCPTPGICAGSSPRVRGKLELDRLHPRSVGLIPARAGKTLCGSARSSSPRAHPRACGENRCAAASRGRGRGSSPRVRGKRGAPSGSMAALRLIPARAGKTPATPPSASSRSAHPRACGENAIVVAYNKCAWGSSPRVRGKRGGGRVCRVAGGHIPARAGKTLHVRAGGDARPAHPRACGENYVDVVPSMKGFGSSPRVRGKRDGVVGVVVGRRLIPACAGKTPPQPLPVGLARAHPRACGENLAQPVGASDEGGSSPRVRGKRPGGLPGRDPRGLIPARAGKTPPDPVSLLL